MRTWKRFMDDITDKEGIQIMKDHEELSRKGMIGDTIIRDKAEDWCRELDIISYGVLRAMDDIHHAITKRFADRYVADITMLNEHTNNGRS